MKKTISITAFVLLHVSSVLGQGYRQAVNRTLNPSGFEEARVLYQLVGWEIAGFVALPLIGMLIYGLKLGEWKRDNYVLLMILGFGIMTGVLIVFPFVFLYL